MRGLALSLLVLCAHAAGQEEQARGLAQASAEAVKQDPELAVLLAREALAAADVEEARTALYAALIRTCKSTVLAGHEGAVTCCDISPDSQLLATGSEDGTARLWTREGQQAASLAGGAMPFQPRADLAAPTLEQLSERAQESFRRHFGSTPVERTRKAGLLRNLRHARANLRRAERDRAEPV